MKKRSFSFILFITYFFLMRSLGAVPTLEGFLENDLELKTLTLEMEKANLSLKSVKLDTGFNITLSSGLINIYDRGDGYKVRLTPSATASLPIASNLSASASSVIDNGDDEGTVRDTKIALSLDIISGAALTRKITLMKAARSHLEMVRKVKNRAISAESEYYTQLKTLFSTYSEIIKARKTLYDDKIDFDDLRAKGYSSASSKYRLAQMKVATDEHEIAVRTRKLEKDCAVFADKCGTFFNEGESFEDFLPKEIPQVDPLNIHFLDPDSYTKTESALYNHELGGLTRRANKNFTLKAGAGYTFDNSASSGDTADISLTSGVSGVDLTAGVSIPVTGGNPSYSASVTLNPTSILKRGYTDKSQNCDDKIELIAIDSAKKDYERDLIDKTKSLIDIEWEKKTNKESYELYRDLSIDMEKNYKAGVTTQSEYLSSLTNREDTRINIIINDIDLIIYNDTVRLLFVED